MDPHSVVERAQLVNGKHLRDLWAWRSATQENKEQYVADDFVAHNPPLPRVSLDRDG